jgi:hypothetical protein
MSEKEIVCIDVEAAEAFVRWKSDFADEVAMRARRLAAESKQPGRVTLSHYREAAILAVRSLSIALEAGGPSRDNDQAA